ncbi:MAG TPA: hypothetical protein VJM33_17395 [Microthrixaceae bacterium]|nr:hypothetical protein [Microthrixaceae bacterium]
MAVRRRPVRPQRRRLQALELGLTETASIASATVAEVLGLD